MHPGAERDMPGGVALGVEGVGIGELTWVRVAIRDVEFGSERSVNRAPK